MEADQTDANLKGARLNSADLRNANLMDANLKGVDLMNADLREIHSNDANFRSAYLDNADLRGAYLRDADFKDASLKGADLRYADLRGADLTGIEYDEYTIGLAPFCPMEGSFIAYRKAQDKIIVLEIPADAKRSSGTSFKCRCNKAKVLRIEELDGSPAETNTVEDDYVYTVGEITVADSFDKDRWNDSTGIDFFIAREMAVIYEKK